MLRSLLVFAILVCVIQAGVISAEVTIRLVASDDSSNRKVSVEGISSKDLTFLQSLPADRLAEYFKLTVEEKAGDIELPPVLGDWIVEKDRVLFTPRFSLDSGKGYRVEFTSPNSKTITRTLLILPEAVSIGEPARVIAIYPSASKLPRNLLKFYVHFSAPMQQGNVYRYLQLTKADGTKLEAPFLEVAEELWDTTGTRLTLLLDPGRVKQGLVPREEDGAIFEVGESYRLTVRSDWPDAQGRKSAAATNKDFSIVNDDVDQPNPDGWIIHQPAIVGRNIANGDNGTQGDSLKTRLHVDSPEPLDQALFSRCLAIFNSEMVRVEGNIEISNQEMRWTFSPSLPWQSGEYTLKIDSVLEDLSGNSIARPFEIDTAKSAPSTIPVTTLRFSLP